LNLQSYTLKEKATGICKRAYLPYAAQLHRSELRDEYYIVNAHRLIPTDEPVIHKAASKSTSQDLLEHLAQLESLSRQLRPELAV